MTDNIIPFDPDIDKTAASTTSKQDVDKMCDIVYTRCGVIDARLAGVIDQLTHVHQALRLMSEECERGGLEPVEIDQYLSDLTLIESLTETFEGNLYD